MGARLTKPVSAADIPGADTAVAHQVPTSDGAGGFTWEDQAGGTPTTDAGDLISGTLAAARLPGVLLNVDTQAELLAAAAAQAAITGSPTGSKFARDTGAWSAIADGDLPGTSNNATISAISTVANAALPKAGGTMTGDLVYSQSTHNIKADTADASDTKQLVLCGGGGNTAGRGARLYLRGNEFSGNAGQALLCGGGAGYSGLCDSSGFVKLKCSDSAGLEAQIALAFVGTQSSAGASIANFFRDSGGNLWANTAASYNFCLSLGNSQSFAFGANGINFYGSQTNAGNGSTSIYRDSSGNLNSNVATGATHISRVNGARVGGFPLVPGDMPAKNRLDVKLASQNATSSSPTLTYGTPTTNDCFTYSAGVWTCTVAGDYLLEAAMFASFNDISQMAFKKNGSSYGAGAGVPINYTASCLTVMSLTVGQTFEVAGYCQVTRALDNTNYFNSFLRATRLN